MAKHRAFGFSEDNAKRVGAAVRRVEGMPHGRPVQRARYPIQTPTLFRPVQMRFRNAIWRTGNSESVLDDPDAEQPTDEEAVEGFPVLKLDPLTRAEVAATVDFTAFAGVACASTREGATIWCVGSNSNLRAVSGGTFNWTGAVAVEAFTGGGPVELLPGGPVVTAETSTSIDAGTTCQVAFDDVRQAFTIVAQRCPPDLET